MTLVAFKNFFSEVGIYSIVPSLVVCLRRASKFIIYEVVWLNVLVVVKTFFINRIAIILPLVVIVRSVYQVTTEIHDREERMLVDHVLVR